MNVYVYCVFSHEVIFYNKKVLSFIILFTNIKTEALLYIKNSQESESKIIILF